MMYNDYKLIHSEVEHVLYLLRSSGCTDRGPTLAPQKLTICKEIEMKLEDQLKLYKDTEIRTNTHRGIR